MERELSLSVTDEVYESLLRLANRKHVTLASILGEAIAFELKLGEAREIIVTDRGGHRDIIRPAYGATSS